mmetsp:Transcript_31639/g.87347  ORF Transcript_31639/g.87347 Transcript_31639/m.87347 type:complete len:173 (-) Transcript_31639:217-735(-)
MPPLAHATTQSSLGASATFPDRLGATSAAKRNSAIGVDHRVRQRWSTTHSLQLWPHEFVNEADCNKLRAEANAREKLLKSRSEAAFASYKARAEEDRQRALSQVALVRDRSRGVKEPPPSDHGPPRHVALKNPNEFQFPRCQRQFKTQVVFGDGRAQLLTRVFLNGKWTYTT